MRVKLTVYCLCGEVIGTYFDVIEEKYPFWCEACGEYSREGKYPWRLATEVVEASDERTSA